MIKITAETKKAILVDGIRKTEYIYDDVVAFNKTAIGIKNFDGKYLIDLYLVHGLNSMRLFCSDTPLILKSEVLSYEKAKDAIIFEKEKNQYYVLFDSTSKVKGPFTHVIAKKGNKNIILVDKGKKWGAFSKDGKLIIPIEYDNIYCGEKCYIFIEKAGKHGLYFYDGQDLIGPIFAGDKIGKTNKYLFDFSSNGRKGIIGGWGERILPPVFDYVQVYDDVPLIYLHIKGYECYYHLNLCRFFDANEVKIYPNRCMYYLNGAWH